MSKFQNSYYIYLGNKISEFIFKTCCKILCMSQFYLFWFI